MSIEIVELANCRFEVVTEGEKFIGLGKVWIGQTLVRSGRLPLDIKTESFAARLRISGSNSGRARTSFFGISDVSSTGDATGAGAVGKVVVAIHLTPDRERHEDR